MVRVIVEGLEPREENGLAHVYQWELTADDIPVWRSDRTSSLVANEYGVATAIAELGTSQFLSAFDSNTTVGYILAYPDRPAPRYWEANVFEEGSGTKVLLTFDVDMGVSGNP